MTDTGNGLVIITSGGQGLGALQRGGCPGEAAGPIAEQDGRAVTVTADVTSEAGRAAIIDAADEQADVLTALVNCAAVSYIAPLFAQDLTKWRENITLNVEAMAFLSFAAMRRISESGGGGIVNIASVYGIVALNHQFYRGLVAPDGPDGPSTRWPTWPAKGAMRQISRAGRGRLHDGSAGQHRVAGHARRRAPSADPGTGSAFTRGRRGAALGSRRRSPARSTCGCRMRPALSPVRR